MPETPGTNTIRRMSRRCCVLGLASLVAVAPAAAALPVWALNYNQNINLVNAGNNAEAPFIPSPLVSEALAADPAGVLYVADPSGVIYSVQGGVPVGATGHSQIADLYYASGGLWGFSNASATLFFFDLGLAAVTYSLPITGGLGGNSITGVTRNPFTGDLYLSGYTGYNADSLLLLDLNTATATTVGSLGHADAFSYVSDIEFDALGTLLAMTWYHRDFYSVNPVTAATTLLSNGPHRDATGFAVHAATVSEPATWTAGVVIAMAGWMRCRRIDRQKP